MWPCQLFASTGKLESAVTKSIMSLEAAAGLREVRDGGCSPQCAGSRGAGIQFGKKALGRARAGPRPSKGGAGSAGLEPRKSRKTWKAWARAGGVQPVAWVSWEACMSHGLPGLRMSGLPPVCEHLLQLNKAQWIQLAVAHRGDGMLAIHGLAPSHFPAHGQGRRTKCLGQLVGQML
eukprot:s4581_g2.t1